MADLTQHLSINARLEKDAKDARIFEMMMEAFIKRWAPDDRHEMAEFAAELHSIVRRVYLDAQEPLSRQIMAIVAAMPMMRMIKPSQPEPPG